MNTPQRRSLNRFVRKSHRWLGVIIGIQFLAWVLGGLYFSWIDLDTIHGEDSLGPGPSLAEDFEPANLDPILQELSAGAADFELHRIELRALPESAVYSVSFSRDGGRQTHLFDAGTGVVRDPLSEEESVALARSYFAGEAPVEYVHDLEDVGDHHEYRELPLPAYAVGFDDSRSTRIYVAPELARVTAIRNNPWRGFDFLWMLHTMDYAGRDNFNNWVLRAFSVLGLITVLSGFWLFFLTRRRARPGATAPTA